MSAVDSTAAVRGASHGFTVLLVGGIVQPWVGFLLPPVGFVWLALVALAAFLVAALGAGGAAATSPTAVVAALGAYGLVLPLVAAAGALDVTQVGGTIAIAVAIGALTPLGLRAVGRLRSTRGSGARPA
jgi:hypothetical protein